MIVITVPVRDDRGADADVDQPADGTTFENGAIPVQGTATNATTVTVAATYDGPVDGAAGRRDARRAARPAPAPITVPVADDGTWDTGATPLQLTTGELDDHRHRVERAGQDGVADPPRRRSPTRA